MVSHHPEEREISAANRNEITTAGSNEIYSPAVGKFLPGTGEDFSPAVGSISPRHWGGLGRFAFLWPQPVSARAPTETHLYSVRSLNIWLLKSFANYLKEKNKLIIRDNLKWKIYWYQNIDLKRCMDTEKAKP